MPATENGIAESVLAEMEARANAATSGPWQWIDGRLMRGQAPSLSSVPKSDDTDDFIAHARTDVPALIAEVRRLSRLSLYDPHKQVAASIEALEDLAQLLREPCDSNDRLNARSLVRLLLPSWSHVKKAMLSTPESK